MLNSLTGSHPLHISDIHNVLHRQENRNGQRFLFEPLLPFQIRGVDEPGIPVSSLPWYIRHPSFKTKSLPRFLPSREASGPKFLFPFG